MYGLARDETRGRTDELLQFLSLHEDRGKLIVDYSQGMRKKLALAAALIHSPRVLFLDEPLNGIDPVSGRVVTDLLRRLAGKGVTLFFTTHVLDVVERLCDEVAIIDKGQIVAQGTLDEIRAGGAPVAGGRVPEARVRRPAPRGPVLDRLIGLVLLRWRLEIRALGVARERAVALAITIPGMLFVSCIGAAMLFIAVRSVASSDPDLLLPALSAVATLAGIFWMLSPLVSRLSIAETHDVSRLLHFPIPAWTLVTSSLLANLSQPMVLAEVPIVLALTFAVAGRAATLPLTLAGVLLSFGVILASAQVTALLLHGAARNRRLQDLATFVGIGMTFLIGLLPLMLIWGGAGPLAAAARVVRATDAFAISPFAWGVRAAVHGGRGDLLGFAATRRPRSSPSPG